MKFSPDTSRLVTGRHYWWTWSASETPSTAEYEGPETALPHHLWGDEVIPPTVEVEPERPPAPVLLPCPFCGGTLVHPSSGGECIVCETCGAEGPYRDKDAVAITAWNTRAAPAPAPAPAEPERPAWVPPVCPAGQVAIDDGDTYLVTCDRRLEDYERFPPPAWPPRIGEIVEARCVNGVWTQAMVISGVVRHPKSGNEYVLTAVGVAWRTDESRSWRWVYRDLRGYVPPGGGQ